MIKKSLERRSLSGDVDLQKSYLSKVMKILVDFVIFFLYTSKILRSYTSKSSTHENCESNINIFLRNILDILSFLTEDQVNHSMHPFTLL